MDDDLTTPGPDETEVAAGRGALRELGDPGPVPADVLARLEGRLEGELGRDAPVRRPRPAQRRRRLLVLAPGLGVAIAAVVVVAVISTGGSSPRPAASSSVTNERDLAPAKAAPKIAAGAAPTAADSAASTALRVLVPRLTGRTVADASKLLRARGLILSDASGRCSPAQRVTAQRPAAGTHAVRGTQVTLATSACATISAP